MQHGTLNYASKKSAARAIKIERLVDTHEPIPVTIEDKVRWRIAPKGTAPESLDNTLPRATGGVNGRVVDDALIVTPADAEAARLAAATLNSIANAVGLGRPPAPPLTLPVTSAPTTQRPAAIAPVGDDGVTLTTDKPVRYVWAFLAQNEHLPRKEQIKHMTEVIGLNPNMVKTQTSRFYTSGGDPKVWRAREKAKRDALNI